MPKRKDFFKHLKNWIVFSQRFLYTLKERPDLVCYGVGSNAGGNSWGMQTNQKALAAFIVSSYEDSIDWEGTGLTAERVREQGFAMLRFTLESHLVGTHHCTDGSKWGHNWISTLGTSRMMHAINAAWRDLPDYDKDLLRKVFISEADWLLTEYPIKAGLVKDNHPESNIWNGALLYQTACLYPDAPNAKAYKDKAIRFIINGMSKPEDEFSEKVYDGIKVRDAFVGANMFDTMACNHHGYMNVGYMVICLSNLGMLYFWCKERGFPVPEVLDHHTLEAWELIRSCTFEDGRLWRIGGDTRVRYCYCQDYALPMWALMSEKYGIDCNGLFEGWLAQVEREVENNGDGSFLSDRLDYMLKVTPYYFTRLDSDRACTLSMIGNWKRNFSIDGKTESLGFKTWHDEYHGSVLKKNDKYNASFTWLAGQRPTSMLVPRNDSTLAEWQQNMSGSVSSFGAMNEDKLIEHKEILFDGGFLTYGKTASESRRFYCEGYRYDTPAVKTLAYALLPDESSALCIQKAVSPNRIYAKSYASLMLRIPNDLFNGNERSYSTEMGDFTLKGGKNAECKDIRFGKWLSVDGKMGVASPEDLTLRAPAARQIDIVINDIQDSNREGYGTLYCNDICASYSDKAEWFNPGDEIYRTAFAVNVGGAKETEALAKSLETTEDGNIVSLKAKGNDGKTYVLCANFGETSVEYTVPSAYEIIAGEASLAPGEALLLKGV